MSQSDIESLAPFQAGQDADDCAQPPIFVPRGYGDHGSRALFSMYREKTRKMDRDVAESWAGDAHAMLIFTGLFSAAVAALLVVTVPDIRPNPQDTSTYYLANIFAQLNGSRAPTLPNPAASFIPPTSALWVNGLWFMSLLISLTCAMLATLVQHWAHRYLSLVDPPYGLESRARIQAFYANGIKKSYLPTVVEMLPALLHVSLFLFFSGLAVFLFGINHTMFGIVVVWIGLCIVIYAYLTILPIRHKDSPFSTPLSSPFFFCLTGIRPTLAKLADTLLKFVRNPRPDQGQGSNELFRHLTRRAEDFALHKQEPDAFYDALIEMFRTLGEDTELEDFFGAIPALCRSSTMTGAQAGFIEPNNVELSKALIGLMDRTLSSNLISEAGKLEQVIIYAKVINVTSLLEPWGILRRIFFGNWQHILQCIEFALSVKKWENNTDGVIAFCTQCVTAATVLYVSQSERECDDRWFWLASGALGSPRKLYRNYIGTIDDILLANATFILRRTIATYSQTPENRRPHVVGAASKALKSFYRLDVSRTSPDRQHEFCDEWNDLVDLAQDGNRPCTLVLKSIRKLYTELHKGTYSPPGAFSSETDDKDPILDEPNTYTKCEHELAEHQGVPDSELHIY